MPHCGKSRRRPFSLWDNLRQLPAAPRRIWPRRFSTDREGKSDRNELLSRQVKTNAPDQIQQSARKMRHTVIMQIAKSPWHIAPGRFTLGQPGVYTWKTQPVKALAKQPIEVVLDRLQPNTQYYYRVRYRQPGAAEFSARLEHSFYTQRAPGSTFTFDIQGDSHPERLNKQFDPDLYTRTLLSAASDRLPRRVPCVMALAWHLWVKYSCQLRPACYYSSLLICSGFLRPMRLQQRRVARSPPWDQLPPPARQPSQFDLATKLIPALQLGSCSRDRHCRRLTPRYSDRNLAQKD